MQADQHPSTGRRRPGRDRHGRGLRAPLAPREVPLTRGPAERFDELVLEAVADLETRWADELAEVEFAVEDVPPVPRSGGVEFDPDVVADRAVPLGRLFRAGIGEIAKPVVVIYRRPIEARAPEREDQADLVFSVVTELIAELFGKDMEEL